MTTPSFDKVDHALRAAGALGETAELHGELCGRLCQLGPRAVQPWLDGALDGATGSSEQQGPAGRVLTIVAEESRAALDEADMSLGLLLPTDDAPLEIRADCLGHWCQGFVHGLTAAAADATELQSGLTGEILRDFSEISKVAFTAEETAAEGEVAYAELVEFVRVSTQLVYEELQRRRGDPSPGPALH